MAALRPNLVVISYLGCKFYPCHLIQVIPSSIVFFCEGIRLSFKIIPYVELEMPGGLHTLKMV